MGRHHGPQGGTSPTLLRLGGARTARWMEGSAMSVTVRFGAQDDPHAARDLTAARAHETVPAVVYLAAARNTYGTLSYRRAVERITEVWPRAVVMDAEACG